MIVRLEADGAVVADADDCSAVHVQTTLDLYGWVREDEALRAAANWKSYISAWQVDDGR